MGVNCRAYINCAPIKDVLTICAILHNAPRVTNQDIIFTFPPKVKLQGSKPDKYGYIENFDGSFVVEIKVNNFYTHVFNLYVNESSTGQMIYSAKANCKNIALGLEIVKLFGGKFMSSDCVDNIDFENDKPLFEPNWCNDKSYTDKINFIKNLSPMTKECISSTSYLSSYLLDEEMLTLYPFSSEIIKQNLDDLLDIKEKKINKIKI